MTFYLFLALSVCLSAARNLITKRTAIGTNKSRSDFFLLQTVLFSSAAILLLPFSISIWPSISQSTVFYGLLYGVLLVASQWMLTLALKSGRTSVCSAVYAMGFIFPTLSGTLFWNEPFRRTEAVGLAVIVFVILLSVGKSGSRKETGRSFGAFLLIAMLASGGLGIMQKIQQSSEARDEKSAFLVIAFALASVVSFLAFLWTGKKTKPTPLLLCCASATGLCFGGANLCNTVLAGMKNSAIVFPLQNIGTIFLSTVLGLIVFREKITPRILFTLALSFAAIMLFSI